MDLKRPEAIISVSTAVGLICASIYVNKQISTINDKLNDHAEALATAVKRLAEIQVYGDNIKQIAEATKRLSELTNSNAKEIDYNLNSLKDLAEDVSLIKELLIEIVNVLNDQTGSNLDCSNMYPPKKTKSKNKSKKSKDKKTDRNRVSFNDDDSNDDNSISHERTRTSRSRNSRR